MIGQYSLFCALIGCGGTLTISGHVVFCFSPWCPESFSVTMHHASPASCQQSEFLEIFTGDRLAPSLRHCPPSPDVQNTPGEMLLTTLLRSRPSLVSCINHWLHAKNNIESDNNFIFSKIALISTMTLIKTWISTLPEYPDCWIQFHFNPPDIELVLSLDHDTPVPWGQQCRVLWSWQRNSVSPPSSVANVTRI